MNAEGTMICSITFGAVFAGSQTSLRNGAGGPAHSCHAPINVRLAVGGDKIAGQLLSSRIKR